MLIGSMGLPGPVILFAWAYLPTRAAAACIREAARVTPARRQTSAGRVLERLNAFCSDLGGSQREPVTKKPHCAAPLARYSDPNERAEL